MSMYLNLFSISKSDLKSLTNNPELFTHLINGEMEELQGILEVTQQDTSGFDFLMFCKDSESNGISATSIDRLFEDYGRIEYDGGYGDAVFWWSDQIPTLQASNRDFRATYEYDLHVKGLAARDVFSTEEAIRSAKL